MQKKGPDILLQKGSAFGGVVQKEILPAVFIGLSEQIGAFLRLKFSEEREEASIPGEKQVWGVAGVFREESTYFASVLGTTRSSCGR